MPVLKKNWVQPYTFQLFGRDSNSYTRNRECLFFLKTALISHPTNPWTVVASSNRSVASTGDNWSSSSDIVHGSNDTWPGSWIILKSPTGTQGPFYMIFNWTTSADYDTDWYVTTEQPDVSSLSPYRVPDLPSAKAGYDNIRLFGDTGSGYYLSGITIVTADDGSFVATCSQEVLWPGDGKEWGEPRLYGSCFFNVLDEVQDNDPYGFVMWTADGGGTSIWQNPEESTWNTMKSVYPDGTPVTCYPMRPAFVAGNIRRAVQEAVCDNPMDTWRPLAWPIEIWTADSGKRMRKGVLSDMYWAPRYMYSWGQPGYDGQNLVAQQHGCMWLPATEPYRY